MARNKKSDPAEYQRLKTRLWASIEDNVELQRQLQGRIIQLVADDHSHIGALKRAAMEKKVPVR